MPESEDDITRRNFVVASVSAATLAGGTEAQAALPPAETVRYSLNINGRPYHLNLEPRVTLLDLLRERLALTGTKKGCDHGQCGACTVLSDDIRVNSCLTLAITQEGRSIRTIEGLATGSQLHQMQVSFVENDGFQCGFCTSGQICSAVAMLREARAGVPSAVTMASRNHSQSAGLDLTDDEIRERMAGNICRCGAYPNIVAAIREAARKA